MTIQLPTFRMLALGFALVGAVEPAIAAPLRAGTLTTGGLVDGTTIVHVTTLADDGPGSLREAIAGNGPRVVVFDVAGTIVLDKDLVVRAPHTTIAGQTAPSPGITLTNAPLRIRTNDVVVQHIAVRQKPSSDEKRNGNLDGISIDGTGDKRSNKSVDVLLENVSVTWSVDELVSIWFPTSGNVTIRDSILAEALQNAGHPKGKHSMGLLIGLDTSSVEITGNLLESNEFRNPVISDGASAAVYNNWISNPGQTGIHFYVVGSKRQTIASVQNNLVTAGTSSKSNITAIGIPTLEDEAFTPDVFFDGNEVSFIKDGGKPFGMPDSVSVAAEPPIAGVSRAVAPTDTVRDHVVAHAGARPLDRDATDKRLVAQAGTPDAAITDAPVEAVSSGEPVSRVAEVPADPLTIDAATGMTRLAVWLCLEHFKLGGDASPQCPMATDTQLQ